MRFILTLSIAMLLGACANPYGEFYSPNSVPSFMLSPYSGKTILVTGTTFDQDYERMFQDGYLPLGHSSFNGAEVSEDGALVQAKLVGADAIILYRSYTNTRTGTTTLTTPTSQTSYHSGTVYGGGISGGYSGTSTTYGTQTTYIPYSVDRYDYGVSYWRRARQGGFGATFVDMTADERRKVGSNKGAVLRFITRGKAAFEADFLPGDVIKRVNQTLVIDTHSIVVLLNSNLGKTVEFVLWRDGNLIEKTVFIPKWQ